MSDEMALSDNVSGEDAKVNGDEPAAASAVEDEAPPAEAPPVSEELPGEDIPDAEPAKVTDEIDAPLESEDKPIEKEEDLVPNENDKSETGAEPEKALEPKPEEAEDLADAAGDEQNMEVEGADSRGVKRRASEAFSDNGDEFVGFEEVKESDLSGYNKVVERLEAEVTAARKEFTPVRNVMGTPGPVRASKRARQDTDGSRPSSALSSRSDGEGVVSNDGVTSSPVQRGGRRATTEMSSPLLRAPLERGWRRELVYRAALDQHSRRNADIYYYSPLGKKLRSTREVAEHLAGTGLTLENFSFFKEPLGVDDPEKEIIRDAKLMRRVESPVASAPAEGKRAHKPRAASPDPPAAHKSPPAKIKVKSMGSRLGSTTPVATPPTKTPAKKATTPAPAADNNNTAPWKKPRPPHAPPAPAPPAPAPPATLAPAAALAPAATQAPAPAATPPPPPLLSRPPVQPGPDDQSRPAPARQLVQPCSLTCGRGVPSLACASCLCLYHPACADHHRDTQPFYCRNCRKSSSPTADPPPLLHKSGVTAAALPALPAPTPRRPAPATAPHAAPRHGRPEKRVLLRMKAASGGPAGERVWAVSRAGAGGRSPARAAPAQALPQSLARLNGRRFIVVPRSLLQPHNHSTQSDE